MLLQFYFSNYRSFEGEGILDMRASGSNELSSHIRNTLNEKVLPVTAIYGANASGKSSVFEAFQFMAFCVLESLSFSDENKKNPYKLKVDSFKFSESREKPSEFEINYIDKKGKKELYYNYGFKIDNSGILEEYLTYNTKTGVKRNEDYTYIFKRERNQKLYLDSSIEKFRENLEISLKDKSKSEELKKLEKENKEKHIEEMKQLEKRAEYQFDYLNLKYRLGEREIEAISLYFGLDGHKRKNFSEIQSIMKIDNDTLDKIVKDALFKLSVVDEKVEL